MLVERRCELDLLHGLFADCRAGHGRVALITGGLASGKTELLDAFCEQAASGATVLTASGALAEQDSPMGVVRQLLRRSGVHVAGAHAICDALLELAGDRPVVIAIDDVHFADQASLEVLRFLRCRMRCARVMLVLTEWERPSLARPPLRAELTRQPHRRIVLGPLTERGVAELLTRRLGSAAQAIAPGCYALGGGNPFLTNALADDQARPGAPRSAPTAGAAFREAVLDCLHRWDAEYAWVAGGMAILGEHATTELVGELTGVAAPAVQQVIDALAAAGIARSGRLRHPAVEATVLEALAPQDRSRLHARAAELLHRGGADPVEVARHAVADPAPGPWVVQLLRHAAEQLLAEDAELALRYLELAMRACEHEPQRASLRTALVRAAWRVNPSAAAPHLARLYGPLHAGELAWRDAAPVIRHLLWQGEPRAAAELLAAAGHPVGALPVGEPRPTSALQLAAHWIYGGLRHRATDDRAPDGAGVRPQARRATAPGHASRRTATLAAMWAGGLTGDPAEIGRTAERVLQGCLGEVLPEVAAAALQALDFTGRWRRAVHWCEALAEEAAHQNATTWRAVLGSVRADIAWRRGDLPTARAQAGAALDLLNAQSWGVLIGFPLSVLILAGTAMGEYDEVAGLLDRPVPDAMFETAPGLRYLHARGQYNLACGRTLAAVDDFERCAASVRAWGLDTPAIVPWRSDLAQAYLELGMRAEARALATDQLGRHGPAAGPRARAVALRVLAACSEPSRRVGILREAVHGLERCADRLELGRALTELGMAYRDRGDHGNARLVLRRADEVARAGNPADNRAGNQIGRDGVRSTTAFGVAALSEAEHKVATLAANGHSNREIGRKLYITVSTVEQHLTRVYRKLNVSGRTDLSSQLSRHDVVEHMAIANEPRVLAPR